MRFKQIVGPFSRLLGAAAPAQADAGPPASAGAPGPRNAAPSPVDGHADDALAVRELEDAAVLARLAGLSGAATPSSGAHLERAARERLAELIDAGSVDFDAVGNAADVSATLAVAALCRDPNHLTRAFSRVDPASMVRLVTGGTSSRVRQLAAQRIEDPATLQQLQKLVRDKDKNVYKIIKQKCDARRSGERQIAQIALDAESACASLERHSHRVFDALFEPSFRHYDQRWRALEGHADAALKARARQATERCREIMAAHARQLEERAARASQQAALETAREQAARAAAAESQRRRDLEAAAAADAERARAAEEKARAEHRAAEALAVRQIGALAAKAEAALREGTTQRAAGLRRAIEHKLPSLPAVPAHVAGRIHKLDSDLNELKQWKDFAVAPKRAELIEAMEALVGSSDAPQALAERIKQLQESWKTISKGIVSDSQDDWQRFHRAAEAAYQPCRAYFETQAALRASNLEKRRNVLERLRSFEAGQSGEHTDWRAVATVLREAPIEWRRAAPVERSAGRAVQAEFDAALGRLQERLGAWHGHNVAQKQSLIERARQLRAHEHGRETAEAIKALQAQWKQIGVAPRELEPRLWEEFRDHCDAVYEKRQQAHAQHLAGLDAARCGAIALCEQVERAADLPGTELRDAAANIAEWRAAFDALGELPRSEQRVLTERFARALKRCESQMQRQRLRDHEQSMIGLLEAAAMIQACAWAVSQQEPASECDARKAAAESVIAGQAQWPKGGAQALRESFTRIAGAAAPDLAANERALRLLCVRSEILTDRQTPPEDQPLRREYQVHRLVKHMGQGAGSDPDDLDGLAFEWIRAQPVAPPMHAALLARFVRSRLTGPAAPDPVSADPPRPAD